MEYTGKLYAKLGGRYIEISHTEDFDKLDKQLFVEQRQNEMLVSELEEIKHVLHGVYNLCHEDTIQHKYIFELVDKYLH